MKLLVDQPLTDELKRQFSMITETVTVRESLSDSTYKVNTISHPAMTRAVQNLTRLYFDTQNVIYPILKKLLHIRR